MYEIVVSNCVSSATKSIEQTALSSIAVGGCGADWGTGWEHTCSPKPGEVVPLRIQKFY